MLKIIFEIILSCTFCTLCSLESKKGLLKVFFRFTAAEKCIICEPELRVFVRVLARLKMSAKANRKATMCKFINTRFYIRHLLEI